MKKIILIASIFVIFGCSSAKNASDLFLGINCIKTYNTFDGGTYIDTNLNEIVEFNEIKYYSTNRTYSNGQIEKKYLRKGKENYYYYDEKMNEEYILLPIKPEVGNSWSCKTNSWDSETNENTEINWNIEIMSINERFTISDKEYLNCVLSKMESRNESGLTDVYFQIYHTELGFVALLDSQQNSFSSLIKIKCEK